MKRQKSEELYKEKDAIWFEKEKIWKERVDTVNYLENKCKEQERQLEKIYTSKGWKLINKLRRIKSSRN